jgi:hypothetical protein
MRTSICLIILCLSISKLNSQNSCPVGYSLRSVICKGVVAEKCIPENLTCEYCWKIIWPQCISDQRAADNITNSYEKALQIAEERKREFSGINCTGTYHTDYSRFKIYLVSANYCNSPISDSFVVRDLVSKINPFLKRYRAEISAYKRYFNNQPYKPGAVIKEYAAVLKQADQNVKKLEVQIEYMNSEKLSEIQSLFDEVQSDEMALSKIHASYVIYVSGDSSPVHCETDTVKKINNKPKRAL